MMEQEETTITYQTDETSPSIGKLAEALSKAQGEMHAASKSADNPFFKSKYADLAEVWGVLREPLSKHNLAVIQTTNGDGTKVVVITRLVHSSGEWVKGSLTLKPMKMDPQGIGSAITYARRYALAAICGVVQEDDDANSASGKTLNQNQKSTQSTPPKQNKPVTPTVSKTQVPITKRVDDGLASLGYTEAQKALLIDAYKGSEEELLKSLKGIYRAKDKEQAKDLLLEMAEEMVGGAV